MKISDKETFLHSVNSVYIERLYNNYLLDCNSVDSSWQEYFSSITANSIKSINSAFILEKKEQILLENNTGLTGEKISKIRELVLRYRRYGHFLAKLDPLDLEKTKDKKHFNLNIEAFGFSQKEENEFIELNELFLELKTCKLKNLIQLLDNIYSGSIGVEFDYILDLSERDWLFKNFEKGEQVDFIYDRKKVLSDLLEVEMFEHFLHLKFAGAKRFSIEGSESFVIAINYLIDIALDQNIDSIILGMSHRGRLATLGKVFGKPYSIIMSEFINNNSFSDNSNISGDVKYHLGYSSIRKKSDKTIELSMAFNPSHLESINPVVCGMVRAKQDCNKDSTRRNTIGILVHGDTAFCGQGVVAENLAMSQLDAYNVGGTIHVVINNQIGFTANPNETRISRYATEFAKSVNVPIIHVNGDDVEAILRVMKIALEYRQKFSKDIVIEIVCYRKYGHNEGDEPLYTQPLMYKAIREKNSISEVYRSKLLKMFLITEEEILSLKSNIKSMLEKEYFQAQSFIPESKYDNVKSIVSFSKTGLEKDVLIDLGKKISTIPSNFSINQKLFKLLKERIENLQNTQMVDWATAEQLAFASLLISGINIRFTGQDSVRGTFSHRHSVLFDQVDYTNYTPLNNLSKNQGSFEIANSNLSEFGVLGFEFGYSIIASKSLVIWEAQFGDFANGAQIIFDQFISASEDKWCKASRLVILLPHGYEGQGPEHSSARLERFLQLAAKNNFQVVYPTIPASFFHLIRRQILSDFKKPLIVMSPKSLLRHKMVKSSLVELDISSTFIPVIDEVERMDLKQVGRLIICSGKVYYDLIAMRIEKRINVIIIRIEQLYPFPKVELVKLLSKYSKMKEFIWCQEEPKNMGAWFFVSNLLNECLKDLSIKNTFRYIGRSESAAPASGSYAVHLKEQRLFLAAALKD